MNPIKGYTEEEKAESVDSGFVSDIGNELNWEQVSSTLQYEYNFAFGLLQHAVHNELSFKETDEVVIKDENKPIKEPRNEMSLEEIREIEFELARLKKGKKGTLGANEAKIREKKLRKKLKIHQNSQYKDTKKKKKEVKKVFEFQTEGAKKIYNNCGKLVYSKFDFSYANKDTWTESKKFDLNQSISKVLKEKEKINCLQGKGKSAEAAEFMENTLWSRAFAKAEGEKVKDNIQKINKSIERKKSKKKQSKKKWEEREEKTKQIREKNKEKKIQNVISRKEKQKQFKSKKKKKTKQKSRVPGF